MLGRLRHLRQQVPQEGHPVGRRRPARHGRFRARARSPEDPRIITAARPRRKAGIFVHLSMMPHQTASSVRRLLPQAGGGEKAFYCLLNIYIFLKIIL